MRGFRANNFTFYREFTVTAGCRLRVLENQDFVLESSCNIFACTPCTNPDTYSLDPTRSMLGSTLDILWTTPNLSGCWVIYQNRRDHVRSEVFGFLNRTTPAASYLT